MRTPCGIESSFRESGTVLFVNVSSHFESRCCQTRLVERIDHFFDAASRYHDSFVDMDRT